MPDTARRCTSSRESSRFSSRIASHRVGPETWAFVPPGVVHTVEVTGDAPARFLVLHAPGSGYGDYVRGDVAAFDQRPAADAVSADPGLVVVRRAGGEEGDTITDRPERRATVLVETDEITISEFHYGGGERGAPRHVHREHADAFLVLDGEFTFHLRDGSHALPAGTLVVFPPGVVHGFDNDSDALTRALQLPHAVVRLRRLHARKEPRLRPVRPARGRRLDPRPCPAWERGRMTWEELVADVTARYPLHESKMFGMPCLKRENGKVVAGTGRTAGSRSSSPTCAARGRARGGAQPFDPGMGRVMKEWVLVPESHSDDWLRLVEQAV